MKLDAFSRDDRILSGVALLLVIDLLFLPWFSFSVGPVSLTFTATSSPDGWTAVLAVIVCLALIADTAVERLSPGTAIPNLGGSRTATRFALCIALIFAARTANSGSGYRSATR